jgi:Zn2+/Cd2+-exporting ATPase
MSTQQTVLQIAGMDCVDEVDLLQKTLKAVGGVFDVRSNLIASKIIVIHDERVTARLLTEKIAETGMTAMPVRSDLSTKRTQQFPRARTIAVGTSGVFTGLGFVLHWTDTGPDLLHLTFFLAAIIAGGSFIFPKAASAAKRLSLDMNLLMTIAVIGAALIGEWSEAAAVTFLFGLSELLEAFSVHRARNAIESLLELAPETALLHQRGRLEEVPVNEIAVGEVIAVKSAARIPLDGEIIAGESTVNQAPITGESMPVGKKMGDQVFAGSINGEGSLDVRVTQTAANTTLARIIHLIEEAHAQKAPLQRFVDAFARYYTPFVMAFALLMFVVPPIVSGGAWMTWFYRALVLLVIACPCALVISTPISIISGLTAMARRGVLIKGGAFLEAIGKLRALAVDKTGTITEGKPRVMSVIALNSVSETQIMQIAAAIDAHSAHPLAQAVVAHARLKGVTFQRSHNYRAYPGRGAEAEIDGHHYFVGNHRLAHELAVCSDAIERKLIEIERQAQSAIIVGHKPHPGCKGEVIGILGIGDAIRANAAESIRMLHDAGVVEVVVLSGDNQRTVDAIAAQLNIEQAHGDLLPVDKVGRVRQLLAKHSFVGMIGDGVNDAPAMATATVGIAMGAAGTDTAIETADIALMKDDLSKVAEAIRLGRRTLRVIQINIGFALAVKAIFLVLAVAGYTSLWLAIAADTGATLVVIANALRLLRV